MGTLKECDYNENAYWIATDKKVLNERTNEEQIELMEELKNCAYNENAYKLARKITVLERKQKRQIVHIIHLVMY